MLEIGGNDREFLAGPRYRVARPRGVVTVVDLFSGCGGLTLGIEAAAAQLGKRTDIRLAVEVDARVAALYSTNFDVPQSRIEGDVARLFTADLTARASALERRLRSIVGPVDFLVGGPPCQGHSSLNNHTRGDDPKNRLYLSMIRAAQILAPTTLIVENVPAVERDRGEVVARASQRLEALGYRVSTSIVSLSSVGVPQRRLRHVLLAVDGRTIEVDDAIASARADSVRDVRWAIGDLRAVPGSIFDDAPLLSPENQRRAKYLLRYGLYDLPNKLRPICQRDPHKYKSMYGRLRWDEPAQTITTGFGSPGQGRYLHPSEPRTLTPHEAARLQFFPDWFDFGSLQHRRALARAIGNAVPPKLSFVVAHHVLCKQTRDRAGTSRSSVLFEASTSPFASMRQRSGHGRQRWGIT